MTVTIETRDENNYDEQKFTELLLYVVTRLSTEPSNGSVMRNKVLAFSDLLHYANYGTAITGATYIKHPLGPAPRGILHVEQQLIKRGEAASVVVQRGTGIQKLLFARRRANLALFKGTEIATVESVLNELAGHTAMEVSDLSHGLLGWQAARELEDIPYFTIFLYEGPVRDSDVQYARSVANGLRLELEHAGFTAAA